MRGGTESCPTWQELYDIVDQTDYVWASTGEGVGTGYKLDRGMILAALGAQAEMERLSRLPDAPKVEINEEVGKTDDPDADWLTRVAPEDDGYPD